MRSGGWGPNPTWLAPHLEEEEPCRRPQRLGEDTARGRPSTGQGQMLEQKPTLPAPGLDFSLKNREKINACCLTPQPGYYFVTAVWAGSHRHPEREAPFCPCLLEFYGYCNGDWGSSRTVFHCPFLEKTRKAILFLLWSPSEMEP